MLRSDTRAMSHVLYVVWYDLSVTKAKGRLRTHLKPLSLGLLGIVFTCVQRMTDSVVL